MREKVPALQQQVKNELMSIPKGSRRSHERRIRGHFAILRQHHLKVNPSTPFAETMREVREQMKKWGPLG